MNKADTTRTTRWELVPLLLLLTGVLATWTCALAARQALGPWQYVLYLGGLVALASGWWFCRRLSREEQQLDGRRREAEQLEEELQAQRRQLEQVRKEAERQLRWQAARLDRREQQLAKKLIATYEWAEAAEGLDLADHELSDAQLAELVEKDRQMIELLERESEELLEKIRTNAYSVDGRFQPTLVRDDVYRLMTRVARIYQPEAEQPLLETSVAQVLRAASRACLHFLVLLDNLPLNVKEYNLNSMYRYVRQAVRAYSVYKSVAPIFPYVNAAYRLGRLAMGANPAVQGTWWFLGALTKRGAAAVATRVINRQALILLHDVVRVIGFEVAAIYGGDFRYRDANWIYGAELTELLARVPFSQRGLTQALKEIAGLELRNEYDRIFLYRLVAQQKSARPDRFRARVCLTPSERQTVAARLERFLEAFGDQAAPATRVEQWRRGLQERLRVQIDLKRNRSQRTESEQIEEAVGCLAAFLLDVKQCEPGQLLALLQQTQLARRLAPDQLARLQANPLRGYDHPNLSLGSPLVHQYIDDLARLAVHVPPCGPEADEVVTDSAAFLRVDPAAAAEMLDQKYVAEIQRRLGRAQPSCSIPPGAARAILSILEPGDELCFVAPEVTVQQPPGASDGPQATWLVALRDRLVALSAVDPPRILWRGDQSVQAELVGGNRTGQCRLVGGQWMDGPAKGRPVLQLPAPPGGRAEEFFAPLLEFCQTGQRASPGD